VWHKYPRKFWNDFILKALLPNEAAIKKTINLSVFKSVLINKYEGSLGVKHGIRKIDNG